MLRSCKAPGGGGSAWKEMVNRAQMGGMREGLDRSRPLDPWRATDFSNIYRYDGFFPSCFCLVLALLDLGIPTCDLSSLAPACSIRHVTPSLPLLSC